MSAYPQGDPRRQYSSSGRTPSSYYSGGPSGYYNGTPRSEESPGYPGQDYFGYPSSVSSSTFTASPAPSETSSQSSSRRTSSSMQAYYGQNQRHSSTPDGIYNPVRQPVNRAYGADGAANPYSQNAYYPPDPRNVMSVYAGDARGGIAVTAAPKPKPPKFPPPDVDFEDLSRNGQQYQGDEYQGGADYQGGYYQPPSRPMPQRRSTYR